MAWPADVIIGQRIPRRFFVTKGETACRGPEKGGKATPPDWGTPPHLDAPYPTPPCLPGTKALERLMRAQVPTLMRLVPTTWVRAAGRLC